MLSSGISLISVYRSISCYIPVYPLKKPARNTVIPRWYTGINEIEYSYTVGSPIKDGKLFLKILLYCKQVLKDLEISIIVLYRTSIM